MKIVATQEHPAVVAIPVVVGVVPIRIEPTVVVVVFDVEHVRIAVGIGIVRDIIHKHHPLILLLWQKS